MEIARPLQVERTESGLMVVGRVAMSDMKRFVLALPGPEVGRYSLKKDFKTGKLNRWAHGSCGYNLQIGFYTHDTHLEVADYTWSWGQKTLRRLKAFVKDSASRKRALKVYVLVLNDTHSQLVEDEYDNEWIDRVLGYFQGGEESVEEPMD